MFWTSIPRLAIMDLAALAAVSKELHVAHEALGATFDHLDDVCIGDNSFEDALKVIWARNRVGEAEECINKILAKVQEWTCQNMEGSGSPNSRAWVLDVAADLDSAASRQNSSSTGSRASRASQAQTQIPEHSSERGIKRRKAPT